MDYKTPKQLPIDAIFKIFVVAALLFIVVHLLWADYVYLTIRHAADQLTDIPDYQPPDPNQIWPTEGG